MPSRWCMQIPIKSVVSIHSKVLYTPNTTLCCGGTFSRIQYGLWDSSSDAGTAQWARGPIDVSFLLATSTTVNLLSSQFVVVVDPGAESDCEHAPYISDMQSRLQ
jgi:hypothetical protein